MYSAHKPHYQLNGVGTVQNQRRSAFTIVELLIVIVVIAILAAITIVAYTGIQERAQTASVQSASSQAGKKIEAFAVTNVDTYPDTLSEVDIIDSSDITYTYIVNNTTNPKNFCLSVADAQNPAISYSFTNSSGSTIEGECVRNLALDPDVTSTSSFQNIGNGSADFTASIDTTTYHDGVGSYRKLITSTGQSPGAIKPAIITADLHCADPLVSKYFIDLGFFVPIIIIGNLFLFFNFKFAPNFLSGSAILLKSL